jgi:antitoxin (DNA-binding transcriptional repressor) of toxin-antitoxin stability system
MKPTAELRARVCRFSTRDLFGTLSYPPGGLRPEANQEHIDNALRVLGLAKGKFVMPGRFCETFVGYLTPDSLGEVTVTVEGVPVDKLTPSSARRVLSKISGPTPVKIEISHEGTPPNYQAERPMVRVKRDKKF